MYNLLIFFFVLAIMVSFICSMLEAVLLSITPSYTQLQVQKGSRIGQQLEAFKLNIDRPLAAILTLNTVAHTVGAIGVGDQAAKIWADTNPLMTSVLIPTIMVLGILILSEIIPKTLGANHWQKLVPFTVITLRGIIWLLYPLVWVSQQITRLLATEESRGVFSRSEFLAMAKIGVNEGIVKEHDSEIIANLFHLKTVRTKDIMTPRTVVRVGSEEQTIKDYYKTQGELPFSRIPLYEGQETEHITGYCLKSEILERLVQGKGEHLLESLKRDITVVPELLSISDLFNTFLNKQEHIALVVDEYGGMAGIVTMEDVMETILGLEITDELDSIEDMQALARKNWEDRAKRIGLLRDSIEE
jgi:CBS domain containing-hemolysin-like protein